MADRTVNEYIASIKEFTKWAVINGRPAIDPLAGLKRIGQKAIELAHPRRALTLDDMARLLDAAGRRPLLEMQLIRHGKRKGELTAKLRPKAIECGKELGKERRIAYLLAFFGRLRRSEIKTLQWSDLQLDGEPATMNLRAEATKSKRADIVPLQFRPRQASADQRVVRAVPNMKALRADLKLARIVDVNDKGLYADLHALGKSFITEMAKYGVNQRMAQEMARHKDPRLTANLYTDKDQLLLPLAREIAKVPRIASPALNGQAESQTPKATRDGSPKRAAPAQRNRDALGHCKAPRGTSDEVTPSRQTGERSESQVAVELGENIKWHDPAPHGTGSYLKAGEGGRTLDIHVGNKAMVGVQDDDGAGVTNSSLTAQRNY